MSSYEGGGYTISPEARSRLTCQGLVGQLEGLRRRILETPGELTSWLAQSIAVLIDSASKAISADPTRLTRLLEIQAELEEKRRETVGAIGAIQELAATESGARATCERLRENLTRARAALPASLPGEVEALASDRSERVASLEGLCGEAWAAPDPQEARRQDAAGMIRTRSEHLKFAAAELARADVEFHGKFFAAAARAGVKTARGERVAVRSEPKEVIALERSIRARLDETAGSLPKAVLAALESKLESIQAGERLSAAERGRRLRDLGAHILEAKDSATRRERVLHLRERAALRMPAAPGDGPLRAEWLRFAAAVAEAADQPIVRANAVARIEQASRELVARVDEAERQAREGAYVLDVAREAFRSLGYNVFEDAEVTRFAEGRAELLAATPEEECVSFIREADGRFHAEIFADATREEATPDRTERLVGAMRSWCKDFDQFVTLLAARGVILETEVRKPAEAAQARYRPLSASARTRRTSRSTTQSRQRERRHEP